MRRLLASLVVCATLAACDSDDSKVSVALKGSAVEGFEAVVITPQLVMFLKNASDDDGLGIGFGERQLDVLALQGTETASLFERAPVSPGDYAGLMLRVDAGGGSIVGSSTVQCGDLVPPYASYVTVDGFDYPLLVPDVPAEFSVAGAVSVPKDGAARYTLEIDLRKSIGERDAEGCYPLNLVMRVVEDAEAGTLAGTVYPPAFSEASCTYDPLTGQGAAVYVYSGADVQSDDVGGTGAEPLTSAFLISDGEGSFSYEVGYLPAGEYTAALTCQSGEDDPMADDDIGFIGNVPMTIEAGEVSLLDFGAAPASR